MSRIIAVIILACMLCSATAPAQSYSMPLSTLKEKVHELERAYDELEAASSALPTSALVVGSVELSDSVWDDLTLSSLQFRDPPGEPQNVHFMATPALTNGSTVQLVCTSDGDGDVLTFNQFKASIKRFR